MYTEWNEDGTFDLGANLSPWQQIGMVLKGTHKDHLDITRVSSQGQRLLFLFQQRVSKDTVGGIRCTERQNL